jgi:hypothetical protein
LLDYSISNHKYIIRGDLQNKSGICCGDVCNKEAVVIYENDFKGAFRKLNEKITQIPVLNQLQEPAGLYGLI